MKFPSLLLIAFLFLILSSLHSHSQDRWRWLTTDDGLSSNVVLSVFQAKNGHIWIGTDKGISRYNGIFQPVFTQMASGVRISSSIFETTKGQLIIRLITISPTPFVKTENKFLAGLEWNEPGIFTFSWISTLDGIVGFEGQKWKVEFNIDNSPLGNSTTNTPLVTSTGKILLGTDLGLFQYDSDLNRLSNLALGSINKILEGDDSTIWVCVQDQKDQKRLYSLNNGQWVSHLPDQAIMPVYQLADNDLWAGGDRGL